MMKDIWMNAWNKLRSLHLEWGFERKISLGFFIILSCLIISIWSSNSSMHKILADKNELIDVQATSLIEVQRLRYYAEVKIGDARAYLLLGDQSFLDDQKRARSNFLEMLTKFKERYTSGQVHELVTQIGLLEQQHQDVFDQALYLKKRHLDSKHVVSFIHTQGGALRVALDNALNSLVHIESRELARAKEDSIIAETQIARWMLVITTTSVLLVLGLMTLLLRMLHERILQNAERDRLYEEAKKAIQTRDEVLAAVSHDLKNPLTSIKLNADLLFRMISPEQELLAIIRKKAANIKSSAFNMENLIQNILDQAQSASGHMKLRLDMQGINEVLMDVRNMLDPLAKQKQIHLQVELTEPPIMAYFDRDRVIRVLSNLIGNAIKFTPENGRVEISVHGDSQFIVVSVSDTGLGIPEKNIAQLFDRFWQARETAHQGTGLGLAIVKEVIEAHKGKVWVKSQKGEGSTFLFSLPREEIVMNTVGDVC